MILTQYAKPNVIGNSMKNALSTILIFITQFLLAQSLEANLDSKIDSLKSENIRNYIIYSSNCQGSDAQIKCIETNQIIILWLFKNEVWYKKLSNCEIEKDKEISESKVFKNLKDNFNQIKLEEILEPTFRTIKTIKKGRKNIEIIKDTKVTTSHYCGIELKINFQDEYIYKNFPDYYIKWERENINYQKNMNSKLFKLIQIILEETNNKK